MSMSHDNEPVTVDCSGAGSSRQLLLTTQQNPRRTCLLRELSPFHFQQKVSRSFADQIASTPPREGRERGAVAVLLRGSCDER